VGRDGLDMQLIWVPGKQEYFCKGDWTTQITLIGFSNFAFFVIANSVHFEADDVE
jgi:hypothetical protein